MSDKPAHVHEIVIRATPWRVWEALTDPEQTRRYYMGCRIESDFQPGSRYAYVQPNGETMLDGDILEIDPPHRMVMTFRPLWTDDESKRIYSRVTFTLVAEGDQTRLTMVHDQLDPESGIGGGWVRIFAALNRYFAEAPVPV